MKDSVYFQHDYNAHNDEKIIKLRMKYGWQGYGIFWALIEIMRESTDVVLSLSELNAFAFRLHCDIKLDEFVNDCISWKLFTKDGEVFYSNRLHKDVSAMKDKSRKASESANLRWNKEKDANAMRTHNDGNTDAMQPLCKDRIGEDRKEEDRKVAVFSVIEKMNTVCGTSYRTNGKTTTSLINARMNEGFVLEDFNLVIEHQNTLWSPDQKMKKYLRPETLYGATKFEGYLNDAKKNGLKKSQNHIPKEQRDDSW